MKDFTSTSDDFLDSAYIDVTNVNETSTENNNPQDKQDNSTEIFYKELPESRQQSDTVFCEIKLSAINKKLAQSLAQRQGLKTSHSEYDKKSLRQSKKFKMKQLDRSQNDDC